MGELIRRHDWAATPLGPVDRWPERLKCAVDICLRSMLPCYVWWGPELIQFYNDASLEVNRAKHSTGVGAPAAEAWAEIWPVVSAFAEKVMSTGEAVLGEDLPLSPERGESREVANFTFSYSAIPGEDGAPEGIFISVVETTSRVVRDRQFRLIFAASPTPFVVLAPDPPHFTITEVNEAFLNASGRSGEDLLGRPLFEAFPDNPAQVSSGVANLRSSLDRALGSCEADVMPIVRYDIAGQDGCFQERYWKPINTPLVDETGRVTAIIHHVEDVTEPHRAQQALKESEERYRLIVESATDYAIMVTDPDDVIVDWLPGSEAVFGWRRDEAIGRPAAITFTPEDREKGVPEWEIATAVREGTAPDVRWHQRKDGGQVFIEGTVTPLRKADGSIRGFLKIGQDVSERRSAEEALAASEARMRSLVTGIPQMVFRSLGSGERIWGSPQWIEYTGLSFEQSLGFGWLDALCPADRQASIDAWAEAEQRGEYYVEHRIRNAATGEYRWHQTRAIPSRDERGRLFEWLGTSSDVEELRQLYRHQQILLAELQHRVRNTLGVIRSIARRTAETSADVDEMAMHLEGRLGAFSRVQTMVTRNPDAGVSLASLIEDELLAHATREGEGLRIEGPAISLKARPAETMSLAIHELATNAVKYGALSDKRGRINIHWQRSKLDGTDAVDLIWEENGVELTPGAPMRQGFGLELLTRTLPYDLRATTNVEFRREGLRFSMKVPLGPEVLAG